ncbi:AAA family ATPase [Vibrio metoecus]|uniref:AAA family ATPase n=1 Tax=Vibrio metoecus TaxID=1481663 RepID=UPI001F501E7F|nr:AAA family ATPase [Vibrio metoecus]
MIYWGKLVITDIVLENVASYRSKNELKTNKKVNIIYGLNGSGKSTFSNYFYNPESTKYQQCSHRGTGDTVLVYNQKFIQDNFYAKDTLNGIFSLSKENKEAKEKVEAITLELEKIAKDKQQIQKEIGEQRSKILRLMTQRRRRRRKFGKSKPTMQVGIEYLNFV